MESLIGEKLAQAIETKKNDVKSFVWKGAKRADGTQDEIKLVDASYEQLISFYNHCQSMLYSSDKVNPGRYVLLNLIEEQRRKCNVELYLRKLESGSICADNKPYPRYLYLQDIRSYINAHKEDFPSDQLNDIYITACTGGLPREFERITIEEVLEACLDSLGQFNNKHITFSFILNMGIYLTQEELKEFDEKDENGVTKSKLEVVKKKLGVNPVVKLIVKPSGLNFKELRAMLNLKPKKYSEMTTDQLMTLRNKVLFKLEDEVRFHISQWEVLKDRILKTLEYKGFSLPQGV